ncbi:NAD(P)H-binding protein [Novosphingobium sp. TH158]|uniref:NAD(P)H-binding protein n=1 Tax=Novosphingobium sp. TH158 TaxID=2067455 RepID=UPI000C7B8255|nr:NAD(P)H-binding protein [Novosphingobium sp. TH158]PLK25587.1 nucleoside-diphosphate sugar epimerase [Novosphingobium sp. TH158]
MSRQVRICLVGATGLVGSALIEACVGRTDVRLVAVSRNEADLPKGARMEVLLAPTTGWQDAIAAAQPDVLVIALGTTWKKAEKSEAQFRLVDEKLVLDCARWGLAAGARQVILVSSAGAARNAKYLYPRVKGEVEDQLARIGFHRVDVLRPGLLIGPRKELRPLERIAQFLSPVLDLLLQGKYRRFRSIHVDVLSQAILALAHQKVRGRFMYEHDEILRAIRRQALEQSVRRAVHGVAVE